MTTDSKDIRTEADDILRSGLRSILGRHGEVHMVGSYVLELMTWRDLDIHVVREHLDVRAFFDLGGEIARLLKPHRMHFRDESTVRTPSLPRGLYWGIYLSQSGFSGTSERHAWTVCVGTAPKVLGASQVPQAYVPFLAHRLAPLAHSRVLICQSV